jgi:hypothetical protein
LGPTAGWRHPNQWAKRLRIARGFAAYLQSIDPRTEIPPPDVFPTRRQRATPYLFSQQYIYRLLGEARRLRHPLRAAGEPKGISTGQPVKVQGLTAMTWEIDGRHGVSFRVDGLEAGGGAPKTAQAA